MAEVGPLHTHVARRRANDLHAFTRALADAHPIIVIETLVTDGAAAASYMHRWIASPCSVTLSTVDHIPPKMMEYRRAPPS